jgi:uncharacterized protein (TIRG00374 family)
MSRGRLRIVFSVLGVVLFFWLVRQAGPQKILDTLDRLEPAWAAVYVPVFFLVAAGIALRWRMVLRAIGVSVPLSSLMSMWFAGVTVSSVTTGAKLGGDPLRAFLLAKRPVPTGLAVASVIMDRAIELLANLSFAIFYCTLFATRDQNLGQQLLLGVVLGGAVFLGTGAYLARRLARGDSLTHGRFAQVLERLGASPETLLDTEQALRTLLFERRAMLLRIVAWAMCVNALIFLEFTIAFRIFGASPGLPELAGAIMGVGLAHSLPIPGSLGALEGAQVAIFGLSGGAAGTAVVAAVVVRSRDLFRALPGALLMVLGRIGKSASSREGAS